MLSSDRFLQIVQHTPLISIDLLIRDRCDRYLLGLRVNQPAQNFWFVPGGRIRKDELALAAMQRIAMQELGVAIAPEEGQFLGVFQHLYEDNFAGVSGISTHYVVLGFTVKLANPGVIQLDPQHRSWRWCTAQEILQDPTVHANTQAYFQSQMPGIAIAQVHRLR